MKPAELVKVGDAVVFYDPVGRAHAAIVTAVWNPPMVNLVFVSHDEARTDVYGRQIERATSLYHKSQTTVHGQYWAYAEEAPNPIVQPSQT
jgi:hypothetical protein